MVNEHNCGTCGNWDDCNSRKSQAVIDVSNRCGLTCHSGFPKTMIDLVAKYVQVEKRTDNKVLWVNTEDGCVLRICGIKTLVMEKK